MPGVEIGDGAVVAAGVIVPKDTVIPPRKIYLGREFEERRHHGQGEEKPEGVAS
jgi:acetyltransferase-like isoleucine patch superfamily enzyme